MHYLLRLIQQHKMANHSILAGWLLRTIEEMMDLLPLIFLVWLLQQDQPISIRQIMTILGLACLSLLAKFIVSQGAYFSFTGAYRATNTLRSSLLDHLRRLPLNLLMGKRSGQWQRLFTTQFKQFEEVFSHLIADIIAQICLFITLSSALIYWQPKLALALLIPLPIAWGCYWIMAKAFTPSIDQDYQQQTASSSQLFEYLQGLTTLRSYAATQLLLDPLVKRLQSLRDSGLKLEKSGGMASQIPNLICQLGIVGFIAMSGWLITNDTLSTQTWIISALLALYITQVQHSLSMLLPELKVMLISAKSLDELSTMPTQAIEGQKIHHCDFDLNYVAYRYEDGKYALTNITTAIKAGEFSAIVGPSGSGKSTLLSLLADFQTPTLGDITLGGCKLSEIGSKNLYSKLLYLGQQVQLFSGTVKENLLIANPQATEDSLRQCIESVGLSQWLDKLPLGLDQAIGENGLYLSGGEKQRLSIARALLSQADILLLDEPTSALDSKTQQIVLESIHQAYQGKTIIMVAHRLETIEKADQIILLENGQISAEGNHQTLIQTSRLYRELCQSE